MNQRFSPRMTSRPSPRNIEFERIGPRYPRAAHSAPKMREKAIAKIGRQSPRREALPLRENVAIRDVQGPGQTRGFEIDRGLAVQRLRDDPLDDGAARAARLRLLGGRA